MEALEGYLQTSHRAAPEPPESTAPPVFQSPIKDQGVREGGFAHFEARLEPVGDSTLRVEWLKDGRPVEASKLTDDINLDCPTSEILQRQNVYQIWSEALNTRMSIPK